MRLSVKIYLTVGFLGLATSSAVANSVAKPSTATSCPICDVDHCPRSLQECSHELVRDECGCCEKGVCLLKEKEKCLNLKISRNIRETNMKFGVCGEDMECLLRTDLRAGETEESVCQCQRQEISCGKDNATYPSVCRLREAGTELEHSGACKTPAEIVSEPEVASTLKRERFSLNCEAKGFPVPHIHWKFEGFNGLFMSLPGDDSSIAVHSRGGPEPFTVTSWLMIEALRPSDAGTYICVAENSEGIARSVVSVNVSGKNS